MYNKDTFNEFYAFLKLGISYPEGMNKGYQNYHNLPKRPRFVASAANDAII